RELRRSGPAVRARLLLRGRARNERPARTAERPRLAGPRQHRHSWDVDLTRDLRRNLGTRAERPAEQPAFAGRSRTTKKRTSRTARLTFATAAPASDGRLRSKTPMPRTRRYSDQRFGPTIQRLLAGGRHLPPVGCRNTIVLQVDSFMRLATELMRP